jgi:hypothetical protein
MHNEFAGQRDFQSEQRFLDGSAPRLRRHAESCEAAGGDLLSSPAGKDQKPSWGVGQTYIKVVEFTKCGFPHYHILIDRRIDQRWISRTWDWLGGGKIVFIKRARIHQVSRYLSKYLTKELLLSAPKGTRRITTARAVKLFPKFQSRIIWSLVPNSISFLYWEHHNVALERQLEMFGIVEVETDEEQFLKAFAVPLNGGSGSESGQQTANQGIVV